ncbi:unnamed protein product [Moneuplotes crassus]|uniref:Uncharacterized protein n=1 Tax=Euplotes crassus TaxID=5936 RepID=A0AAD1UBS5_EUPCR|nr:unnamed protein product [Moneuplotes crassus]
MDTLSDLPYLTSAVDNYKNAMKKASKEFKKTTVSYQLKEFKTYLYSHSISSKQSFEFFGQRSKSLSEEPIPPRDQPTKLHLGKLNEQRRTSVTVCDPINNIVEKDTETQREKIRKHISLYNPTGRSSANFLSKKCRKLKLNRDKRGESLDISYNLKGSNKRYLKEKMDVKQKSLMKVYFSNKCKISKSPSESKTLKKSNSLVKHSQSSNVSDKFLESTFQVPKPRIVHKLPIFTNCTQNKTNLKTLKENSKFPKVQKLVLKPNELKKLEGRLDITQKIDKALTKSNSGKKKFTKSKRKQSVEEKFKEIMTSDTTSISTFFTACNSSSHNTYSLTPSGVAKKKVSFNLPCL